MTKEIDHFFHKCLHWNPSHDIKDYISYLGSLIDLLQKNKHPKTQLITLSVAHNLIRHHQRNVSFPFDDVSFLVIIKHIMQEIPSKLLVEFISILPQEIQDVLANNNKTNETQETHEFLQKIISKFTIKTLLSAFSLPFTGDEQYDRDEISVYILMLQEILYCYDHDTKEFSKAETFELMCKIKGLSLRYYRLGASYTESVQIFQDVVQDKLGETAEYICRLNIGNFINGIYLLTRLCHYPMEESFFRKIFQVADYYNAYTITGTMQTIPIPNPSHIPIISLPAFIIDADMQSQPDYDSISVGKHVLPNQANINIDIG